MKLDRSDAGFSLSALIFFLAAASIFIAAAVPAYQMQAKREMEEELIFRGEEYTRAIQKYQRKFGVYPTSIDQLVSTNGLRFLAIEVGLPVRRERNNPNAAPGRQRCTTGQFSHKSMTVQKPLTHGRPKSAPHQGINLRQAITLEHCRLPRPLTGPRAQAI